MRKPHGAGFVIAMLMMASAVFAQPAKVLIVPFESAGPNDKTWIAKAIGQNLLAELSRLKSVEPALHATVPADQAEAIKLAKAAGAKYLVTGSYQALDADLRITGQVIDVSTGQSVAGLKATGTLRDLFGLEDTIAAQVKRALPQPVVEAKVEMLPQPVANPAPAENPRVPVVLDRDKKLDALEAELDKAIERLKYRDRAVDNYYFDGGYSTHGGYRRGYGYNNYNCYPPIYIGGGYWGGGGVIIGAAKPDGRNYSVPTGNYAVHQGNYIKPTK